jgi:hypothetical protein
VINVAIAIIVNYIRIIKITYQEELYWKTNIKEDLAMVFYRVGEKQKICTKLGLNQWTNKKKSLKETGNTFSLVMIQPIQYYSTSFKIGSPLMEKPIEKRCKFEWTGKVYLEENHPYNHGRIYQLVGIEDF